MKNTITVHLDLDHIHEDLIDIKCIVHYEAYKGSNQTDDPDEITILRVTLADPNDCPLIGTNDIVINEQNYNKIEEEIYASI